MSPEFVPGLLFLGRGLLRVIVYIDGFNLYYGLYTYNPGSPEWVKNEVRKNKSSRWLDLYALFRDMLPDSYKIRAVKYFTAFVNGDRDPSKPIRQQAYINALQKCRPEISVILGQFKSGIVSMPLEKPMGRNTRARVIKTEEKGSDVNLAVHMVNDGWKNEYDVAVVCSNDTDLIEAIKIVKGDINKKVYWVTPATIYPSKEMKPLFDSHRIIKNKHLRRNQLPDRIPGTSITKPNNWK
jgi:uncharacterized LabA/DUF88 family protein